MIDPVAGLVSKTWTTAGVPAAPGVNAMLAEYGPRWPSGPEIEAGPDLTRPLDESRTSTASWLCWAALPRPVTVTGLVIVAPFAGAEIVMSSSRQPNSLQRNVERLPNMARLLQDLTGSV